MPHPLAKLSEAVRRFFGSRVVSSSDKKPQVEPVGPSTPRLPLEILFDIADLVLFSLEDCKDSYHTFACSLSAVSRAFYRQYCHFRRSRTLIVPSEPHALVILGRLRRDAVLAAAVNRLHVSGTAWLLGKAPGPETVRSIRGLLPNLSQFELRSCRLGFSRRTVQALMNGIESVVYTSESFSNSVAVPSSVKYLSVTNVSVTPMSPPVLARSLRPALNTLVVLALNDVRRSDVRETIEGLLALHRLSLEAVSLTGCSLICGNILDNLPALKILQIDIQLLRPRLLTLDRLHLILYLHSDILPYPHTPTSLALVFPLPLIPSLVAQHLLTLLSPISRTSLLSNPHWSALVQRFLDAGAAVHQIEHDCEELFRRKVVKVLGRRAPREYFYS